MVLSVTPGPLPNDGTAFANVGGELEAYVEGTEIQNIGIDSFVNDNTPFVISSTEPPAFITPGQLWYKRGEGRLYCRFTTGVSSESWAVTEGGNGLTLANAAYPMEAAHWMAVSDRREVYCVYFSDDVNRFLNPHQPARLEAGYVSDAQVAITDDTIKWSLGENRPVANATVNLWGTNKAYLGMRLGAWGGNVYSSKLFTHTTNQTIPGRTAFAGVFHELGFRRVATYDATGPDYAGTEGVALGASGSDPAVLRAAQVTKKSIHTPAGNPYEWDFGEVKAFVGYITESGPRSGSDRMLTFWFGSTPRNMFDPD